MANSQQYLWIDYNMPFLGELHDEIEELKRLGHGRGRHIKIYLCLRVEVAGTDIILELLR